MRRDHATLLVDPSLGLAVLLPNHLKQCRLWHERITLVESFPLVFVERFAEPDRRLTALCRRDPDGYADWERRQLEDLWRDLGFSA